ncbi:receptor-like protein kinase [Seminavis robusta]|uniref:Receptor-like protein kinase n=1 Tax=Seminavis robusta TaxID=568900 RepID=A0A9N8DV89_9STRA|nr:receptor-like protein kinase [Seminavis robusta]|eukprot:Sro308_g113520.1 receptor-like protein kinase (623) ;mRNA; f:21551-23633
MTTEEETGKPSNLGSTHNQEHEHKEGQQEQKLKEQQKNERQSTLAQAKRSIAYPAAKKKKNQTDFVETCLRTTTTTGATTAAHKVATGSAMLAKEKQYIAYPKQRKSVSQTHVPPAANTNEAKSGEVSALLAHEKRHIAYPRSGPYDKSRATDNKQGYRPDAEVLLPVPVQADSPGNSSQASKSTTDNSTLLQAAKSTTGIKYPRGETNRTAIKNVVRSDMVRNDDNRGIMPLPPPEGGFACENSEPHPSRDEPLVQEREIVLPNTDQSNSRDAGHGISNVTEVVDQATTPTDNNSGLAVATQVDENEEPTQIARPDNLHGKNGSTVTTLMILVLVGSLLIIGVIVGSICGAGLCSNKEGDVETGYSVLGDIQNRIEEAFGPDYFMKTDEPEHTQPKFKALDWIMFEDPLQLEPDSNNLLQRFIVVLTYFQTSREGDWLACGPSSTPNDETCWFQIQGSDSLASRWLTGVHECQWAGIYCDGEKRITQLRLRNNGLNGPLPAELASLLALESIDFPGNQLTGSIPVELFGSSLSKILLTNNSLTGTVPTEVGLFDGVTLGFGSNSLSGSIPTDLFQAGKRISSFYFYDNKELYPLKLEHCMDVFEPSSICKGTLYTEPSHPK